MRNSPFLDPLNTEETYWTPSMPFTEETYWTPSMPFSCRPLDNNGPYLRSMLGWPSLEFSLQEVLQGWSGLAFSMANCGRNPMAACTETPLLACYIEKVSTRSLSMQYARGLLTLPLFVPVFFSIHWRNTSSCGPYGETPTDMFASYIWPRQVASIQKRPLPVLQQNPTRRGVGRQGGNGRMNRKVNYISESPWSCLRL